MYVTSHHMRKNKLYLLLAVLWKSKVVDDPSELGVALALQDLTIFQTVWDLLTRPSPMSNVAM